MPDTIALVSGLVELLLSFVLGILVAFGAFRLFSRLTKDMDEVDEIRKNNVAVAVVLVSMVVSTGLVARAAIYPVIGALQSALLEEPFREVRFFHVGLYTSSATLKRFTRAMQMLLRGGDIGLIFSFYET